MGVKQFASSLSDFNQEQLDTINAAVAQINAAVTALKNTDMAQLSSKIESYRTATRYSKLMGGALGGAAAAGWTTLLSVTGKGIFNGAVATSNLSNMQLRITIDGVVRTWTLYANQWGIGMYPYLPKTAGNYAADPALGNLADGIRLAYDDYAVNASAVHPFIGSLYFNTNLKIEIYAASQIYSGLNYFYDVGVIP